MRLTLRTLLAYLDDTLEPTEIRQIGLKVAESDAARELIARIKQITRRRRLTTPPATGPGARFDPNTTSHHHALCERCGKIHDIPAATLAPTAAAVRNLRRKAPGFSVRSVERIYRGLCSACSREGEASDSHNR